MKKVNIKLIALISFVALLSLPSFVFAGVPVSSGPDPATWFKDILNNILGKIVWPIFFGLSVLMFIWAGILFVTAAGDPGKIATAKKAVVWAIIGIIVAIVGFSAESIISGALTQTPAPSALISYSTFTV